MVPPQVLVRFPCCLKFYECIDCHDEADSSHDPTRETEMVFQCKKCDKCFRKNLACVNMQAVYVCICVRQCLVFTCVFVLVCARARVSLCLRDYRRCFCACIFMCVCVCVCVCARASAP